MLTCPKCGKEVEREAQVCICGATLEPPPPEQPGTAHVAGAPVDTRTRGQLALAGAKGGAILGAIYGSIFGLIRWVIALVFTVGDTASRVQLLAALVLTHALVGIVILAPIGALLRVIFPPKARAKKASTDPSAKTDTKMDP
jgi:hypothetical protein